MRGLLKNRPTTGPHFANKPQLEIELISQNHLDQLCIDLDKDTQTSIGPNCTAGSLDCNDKAIVVHGKVIGDIKSTGAVIVTTGACVIGSITAKNALISGSVSSANPGVPSKIQIEGIFILTATAEVISDVQAGALETAYGAVVEGRMTLNNGIRSAPAALQAENTHPTGSVLAHEAALLIHAQAPVLTKQEQAPGLPKVNETSNNDIPVEPQPEAALDTTPDFDHATMQPAIDAADALSGPPVSFPRGFVAESGAGFSERPGFSRPEGRVY